MALQVLAAYHGLFARQMLMLKASSKRLDDGDEERFKVSNLYEAFYHVTTSIASTELAAEDF